MATNPLSMKKSPAARRAILIAWIAGLSAGSANAVPPLPYPAAARDSQVDLYHGVKVADPYRWLEDIDSAETRSWVAAEDRLSRGYLDAIAGRPELTDRRAHV